MTSERTLNHVESYEFISLKLQAGFNAEIKRNVESHAARLSIVFHWLSPPLHPWDCWRFLVALSRISTSSAFYELTARDQMFSGLISNRSGSHFCCFSEPPQIVAGWKL